jgi:1,2-dihydroxy-3-keto-5-methylthiopentene dioxygenase
MGPGEVTPKKIQEEKQMTLLQAMPDDRPDTVLLRSGDAATIETELKTFGIQFRRWVCVSDLDWDSNHGEVLSVYADEINELKACGGYRLVDVASMRPNDADPAWTERANKARATFLNEHWHTEDEVRFFAAGRGCFYLHLDGRVLAVVCEAGDLLSVPAGTPHWFDMGTRPDFVAVRFFEEKDGWVGNFTGTRISALFPTLDELVVAR